MTIQSLIELLAPAECVGCGAEGAVLCQDCRRDAAMRAGACFLCGRPSADGGTCASCQPVTKVRGVSVAVHYEGAVKEMILLLKFHRARSAAGVAAEMILSSLPAGLKVEVVCGVPVSAGRYRERGYNQSDLVARRVAAGLGLPFRRLLVRRGSVHQLGTGRQTRFEQVAGAFAAIQQLPGQRVLLVDDVVTTGATLDACANELVAAGAVSVWGATVARH